MPRIFKTQAEADAYAQGVVDSARSHDGHTIKNTIGRAGDSFMEEGPTETEKTRGAEDATMTFSEHHALMEKEHNDRLDRQFAIVQARKAHPVSSAANLVSEARKILDFLSGTSEMTPSVGTVEIGGVTMTEEQYRAAQYPLLNGSTAWITSFRAQVNKQFARRLLDCVDKEAQIQRHQGPVTIQQAHQRVVKLIESVIPHEEGR